jgi:hypothetical protein
MNMKFAGLLFLSIRIIPLLSWLKTFCCALSVTELGSCDAL